MQQKIIVTVHGTGLSSNGFADQHVAAVAADLGWVPPHRPVWWGDLIDAGGILIAGRDRVARWLEARRRAGRLIRRMHGWLAVCDPVLALIRGVINGIAGPIVYFLVPRRRRIIHQRLREALAEASRSSSGVVLLSHSLGCLIAFDVLQSGAQDYNIVAWITLGCPLALVARTIWRRRDVGSLVPAFVPAWYNVYSAADLFGQAIGEAFPACAVKDRRVMSGGHPAAAHRYWDKPEVARIVADILRS